MDKVKVLHFITGLDVGGAETLLLSACRNIDSSKYEIDVCFYKGDGTFKKEFEKIDIKVFNLTEKKSFIPKIIYFFRILKTNNYKILHLHLFHAIIIGRFVGALAGVKKIITTEHNTSNFSKNIFIIWLYKVSLLFNDHIFAISEAVKNIIISRTKVSPSKISVLYDAIDLKEFQSNAYPQTLKKELKIENNTTILGTVGRLDSRKGFQFLIEAMPNLLKINPSLMLVIVGDGEQLSFLKKLASKNNVISNIIFAGYQKEIAKYLSIFNLFVLPSIEEGLSIAIIEAIAMKINVIASNVGGIPELITNGVEGILFEKGNSKAIVEAVSYMLANKEIAQRMREDAYRKVVSRFSIQTYNKMLFAKYDEILNLNN